MGMPAVRRADPAALGLSRQSLLLHDAKHFLVVVPEPSTMQLLAHPTVSVAGELFDHGLDAGDERLLPVGPVLGLVVICAAGQVHQLAPPFDAVDEVAMLSDELPLLFGGTRLR